ncbi:MAG TPA: hypothetical protein VNR61_18270 [Niallia sp.]|nr:hypothetical protein [Niallia sp.]
MNQNYRVGLIVPSSNTTMETEIPSMLQARHYIILMNPLPFILQE